MFAAVDSIFCLQYGHFLLLYFSWVLRQVAQKVWPQGKRSSGV